MTDRPTRRGLMAGTAALAAAPALAQGSPAPGEAVQPTAAPGEKPRTRLILLGTKGGPRVGGERANPASALVVGDTPYIVDCGYGVTRQMAAAGLPLSSLRYLFVTHHRSDRNLEYGNLYYNAWVTGSVERVEAYGAQGLEALTRDFFRLNHIDIDARMADEGRKQPRDLLVAKDIVESGPVMANDRVKVTALGTAQPPPTGLALRFETPDGVVVFSGDTADNPALPDFAKGADILVHEALHVPSLDALVARVPNAETLKKRLLDTYTSTEDVGRVAQAAGVKLLVLSHLVPGDIALPDEAWLEGVRRSFTGRTVVGRDLMEIALPLA